MTKPRIGLLLISLAMWLGPSPLHAQTFSVDAVKAAFLHRFASYVEWPADGAGHPFVIAVAGNEEVANHLDELLPHVKVRGRPAQLRRVARAADLDGVHILYIGPGNLARTRTLRAAAGERPILIVTDDDRGLEAGAVINFVQASRNVRFEISLIAADRARLKVDSALLSVATRVERRPQSPGVNP